MANNDWNDDKIEKLLHSMPKIEDHRSPEDMLDRLKKDARLKESKPHKRQRKWVPAFIAVAALLVVSLMIPSILRQNEGALDSRTEHKEMENFSQKRSMDRSAEEEQSSEAAMDQSDQTNALYTVASAMESHLVLPDEVDGQYPFHIGLVHSANVIPVTVLLTKERVEQDMVVKGVDSIGLYNQYAAKVPESDLGFDEYHPYKGKVYGSGDTVVNEVPADHGYDLAEATLYSYYNSAKETFKDYKLFRMMDEAGKPVELDQVGIAIPVSLERKLPYFKYRMPSGKVYLIPYENGDTDKVSDALLAMKDPQNDIVESVVPAHLNYDVAVTKDIAVITFSEEINLDSINPVDVNEMIEGFMLTGSSFDTKIQIKNTIQTQYGKYDLTEPLPIPVGANPMFIPE
ncbi:Ig-like domain-containing protein [Sporosarcina sp. Te-1]|uniref:Ig-like domain-containing protein n=1 Tax=Sporosarcina sp. Te-1 TaxID=2818390 RepID=UPI001A9ECEB1|nr:Ig-like domain-containing protein [Sporosarcina sp. Te-1]QTD42207.1 hypothetical protein J3U78_05115 [Sporosarcina sp. Te-1]